MNKVFILFFAMTLLASGNYPVTQFQQEFKKEADCDNALEKLKQDAAKANLKVIVGRCVPAEA